MTKGGIIKRWLKALFTYYETKRQAEEFKLFLESCERRRALVQKRPKNGDSK